MNSVGYSNRIVVTCFNNMLAVSDEDWNVCGWNDTMPEVYF